MNFVPRRVLFLKAINYQLAIKMCVYHFATSDWVVHRHNKTHNVFVQTVDSRTGYAHVAYYIDGLM